MKKKYLLIFIVLAIIIILGIYIFKSNKFYLEDNYYGSNEFIEVTSTDIDNLSNESYILYVYNSYCSKVSNCKDIFKEFMEEYNVSFLAIPFTDFKNTSLYDTVKYSPSIIIVNKGKIVTYLDSNIKEDLSKYEDINSFKEWFLSYVYIK